jgi:tagaturonate reductase
METLSHQTLALKNQPGPFGTIYPEKVLQFGTGVLLRGLPDYHIQIANQAGVFRGSIAVVKSTGSDTTEFSNQDNLYTLCARGLKNSEEISEDHCCSSISRVLAAPTQWDEILAIASSPTLEIILSNTTEVGIQLNLEKIQGRVPDSFPAKLLAVLHARYHALGPDVQNGLVIIPTELILSNGDKLRSIVQELAEYNQLGTDFLNWLQTANRFCNSLVDRIVPGRPDAEQVSQLEKHLGYQDGLLCVAEAYNLWAIEGDEDLKAILSFAAVNPGVIIAPNIELYRELKLRLLNGVHTFASGIAVLTGIKTVKAGMADPLLSTYIEDLALKEIAPSIPYPIELEQAQEYAREVLDRFRNPHLQHLWINITLQYSSKMNLRNLPLILEYHRKFGQVPPLMAFGFAAYLQFMYTIFNENGQYFGRTEQGVYPIKDDHSAFFNALQSLDLSLNDWVARILAEKTIWGRDLNEIQGFANVIVENLVQVQKAGVPASLTYFRGKVKANATQGA